MKAIWPRTDPDWLGKAVQAIRFEGIAVLHGVLDEAALSQGEVAAQTTARAIEEELGVAPLAEARRLGHRELRLVMKYDAFFLALLEVPEVIAMLDATLGVHAVLRFQNLIVIPPAAADASSVNANRFHMNTPRVMPGYLASVDFAFALSGDVELVQFVPGSHQRAEAPLDDCMEWAAVPVTCPHGGLVVLDSTLWHRESPNRSRNASVLVLQQMTRAFIQPHFDFVRALGEQRMLALPERTRQLLGWHTRLPESLDDFYQPPSRRKWRPGQG